MINKSKIVYIRRRKKEFFPGDLEEDKIAKIGSALKGSVVLRGLTFEEEEKYLPTIVGSNPKKEDWNERCEKYWKNIAVVVPPGIGKELEIGFKYATQEDADQEKNPIEPINVQDYILWRYCLVYSHVANKPEEQYNSNKIRFYLYAKADEAAKKKSEINIKLQANKAYVKLLEDKARIREVLTVFRIPITNSMTEDEIAAALYDLVENQPDKLVKVVNDEDLAIKSFIERAINSQELKRIVNTETIVLGDSTVIGATVADAVAYFKLPENKVVYNSIEARMKNLK